MKIKILFRCVIFLLIFQPFLFSQEVPCILESRRVDWQNAGMYEPYHIANNIINIKNYSGSDYDKIISAISDANSLPGTTIIFFPSGTYHITNTINIMNIKDSGIIFIGEGSNNTVLQFVNIDVDNHCFNIYGQYTGDQKSIDSDISKGSQWLYTNDGTSGIATGDWIHFREPGFDDDFPGQDSWNGQISKVEKVYSRSIKIKDKASKSYSSSNSIWIREIDPVYNIGFENFKIERTNTTKGYGATFKFLLAVNCWIRGVESYKCTGYHISIGTSSHIEISGCYLHHATNYGSNEGTGYGVVLGASSTNCLIENNIFKKTRHAMLVGSGANCNVFTFNYSREPEWDWDAWDKWWWPIDLDPPEICLHGTYPYANLFESNSIGLIGADPSHGDNGPYNTFFRNKTYLDNNMVIFNANYSNVVGNDIGSPEAGKCVRYDPAWYEALGYSWGEGYDVKESLYPFDVYMYNSSNSIDHAFWSVYRQDYNLGAVLYSNSFLQDISYYYTSRPEFLNGSNYSWPAIGPHTYPEEFGYDFVIGEIPAENRYTNFIKTYNNSPIIVYLSIAQFPEGSGSGGTYKVNGINVGSSYSGSAYYGQQIEAIPPSNDYAFYQWSDGSFANPRTITQTLDIYAIYKGIHKSNTTTAWDVRSVKKTRLFENLS